MSEQGPWHDFLFGRITKESTAIARGETTEKPQKEEKEPIDWKALHKKLFNDPDFRKDHYPALLELGKLISPSVSLTDKARRNLEQSVWSEYQEYLKKKQETQPASQVTQMPA